MRADRPRRPSIRRNFSSSPRIFHGCFFKAQIAKVGLTAISSQLELYKLENGQYPTSDRGLAALVQEPTSDPRPMHYREGGYIGSDSVRDPWQNPYHYERHGDGNEQPYELYSLGRDGLPGGEGEDADVGIPTITAQR